MLQALPDLLSVNPRPTRPHPISAADSGLQACLDVALKKQLGEVTQALSTHDVPGDPEVAGTESRVQTASLSWLSPVNNTDSERKKPRAAPLGYDIEMIMG